MSVYTVERIDLTGPSDKIWGFWEGSLGDGVVGAWWSASVDGYSVGAAIA